MVQIAKDVPEFEALRAELGSAGAFDKQLALYAAQAHEHKIPMLVVLPPKKFGFEDDGESLDVSAHFLSAHASPIHQMVSAYVLLNNCLTNEGFNHPGLSLIVEGLNALLIQGAKMLAARDAARAEAAANAANEPPPVSSAE